MSLPRNTAESSVLETKLCKLLQALCLGSAEALSLLQSSEWDPDVLEQMMNKRVTLFAEMQQVYVMLGHEAAVSENAARLVKQLRDTDACCTGLAQARLEEVRRGIAAARTQQAAQAAYNSGSHLGGKGYFIDRK